MRGLTGITIAVGEAYANCLSITLRRNMRHFDRSLVITTPVDHRIQSLASSIPGVSVFETNAFYDHGACFNKGYAMELGFDVIGRRGWILIWDADILLPGTLPTEKLDPKCLHGARRRMLIEGPAAFHDDLDWSTLPINPDKGPVGFFQLFNAHAIEEQRPWYDVTFAHAGGGDAYFLTHWPKTHHRILPMEVLHLGDNDRHWFGTDAQSIDLMAAFVHANGWKAAAAKHDLTALDRVQAVPHRVEIPGYDRPNFEIPHAARPFQSVVKHKD